jgi:tetratricopeptide (TPR) repeat protein
MNARASCSQKPGNKEYARVLIDLLLSGGFLNEAEEHLTALESEIPNDTALMLSKIAFLMMKRRFDAADELTAILVQKITDKHELLRLGTIYETARQDGKAGDYYTRAIEAAHYPEAYLGLARLALHRKDKEAAKANLLAALDTEKTLGENGVGALTLFHVIVGMLRGLRNPDPNCRAWLASFPEASCPKEFEKVALLVVAANIEEARKFVEEIFCAIQPKESIYLPKYTKWEEAPGEQQPVGPAQPGVFGVATQP